MFVFVIQPEMPFPPSVPTICSHQDFPNHLEPKREGGGWATEGGRRDYLYLPPCKASGAGGGAGLLSQTELSSNADTVTFLLHYLRQVTSLL